MSAIPKKLNPSSLTRISPEACNSMELDHNQLSKLVKKIYLKNLNYP